MVNIIANIKSGSGRGLKHLKKILAYCAEKGIDHSVNITGHKGHAVEIARALTQNGGTVVALGGDGTFHEVLNGIVDTENTKIGFIPSGTGNDFARSAKFSSDPIEAFRVILAGKTEKIDYIQVSDKRCLNVCGTGLDIKVLELTAQSKNKLSYLKSLIHCLNHYVPCHATVTADDGEIRKYECIMVGVCNGLAFGGNIRISPLSKIDDGIIDVIIMQMPKSKKIMSILPKFVKGKHMDMPITTHIRCKSVKIESDCAVQLDGEIYRDLAFDCKIVEGGINVFMP